MNKPCIIGEFGAGAVDRGLFGSGMTNAGSQAGRAAYYSTYLQTALLDPSIVGVHWFEYADEPVAGRTFDGENYNTGIVDVTDSPYPELVAAATSINASAYDLRYTK